MRSIPWLLVRVRRGERGRAAPAAAAGAAGRARLHRQAGGHRLCYAVFVCIGILHARSGSGAAIHGAAAAAHAGAAGQGQGLPAHCHL